MGYRYDGDLEFLKDVKSGDLANIVDCLVYDKQGKGRLTERLTASDEYKTYYPDHHQYWQAIAAEIQHYGANSFASVLRLGKGVEYKVVLMDVCDKLKVNYNPGSSVEKIETYLLMKVLVDEIENMSADQLKDLAQSMGVRNIVNLTPEVLLAGFQAAFHAGGYMSYQMTLIIVNSFMSTFLNRGLSLAANLALTRSLAVLTGPIGWAMTGLWTAVDMAGPAYRVTIPVIIQVAALRQRTHYLHQ